MVKSYKAHSFINGLRFSCANAIKANKVKIIITFILILVAIFTGVFIAVRSHNTYSLYNLQEISLDDFYSGVAASASAFGSRTLSLFINVTILVCLSFSPYLFPLSLILFVYRGYLFGLNFALIFIFYGVGSIFTAVIIILPCQLLTLFVMVIFYLVLERMNCNCRRFGKGDCNRLFYILAGFVLFVLINLVETLLLCLLSGRVIMVI